jgi:hypothetical protein
VPSEPAVFAQDDDGIVVLLTDHPTARPRRRGRGAVSTDLVGDLGPPVLEISDVAGVVFDQRTRSRIRKGSN